MTRLSAVLKRSTAIVGLAIAYYLLAELSRHIASTPQDVTPVWPPDGLAVGSVALLGNWMGYGVFLGSFLANFWAFRDDTSLLTTVISTLPVIGIALGTTLGTFLSTFFLRQLPPKGYPLLKVAGVFKFFIFTAMVGPMVNATFGVGSLALNQSIPWSSAGAVWLTWWISNVSGILIVTPILLSWSQWRQGKSTTIPTYPTHYPYQRTQNRLLKLWQKSEPCLLVAVLLGISNQAFAQGYQLEYMLIPVLLWSAFRIEQRWVTLLILVTSSFAVVSAVNGQGSLAQANLTDTLINLQLFIGVVTGTVLILTATIAERRQAESNMQLALAELEITNNNLERHVDQRTEELNTQNVTLQNTLATLKKTQLQMVQSEKMSALGHMVAGIAHEINNPITFVHGNIEHIDRYTKDLLDLVHEYQKCYPHPPENLLEQLHAVELDFLQSDLEKLMASMQMGSARIRDIVLSLRNFSRLDESDYKIADIHTGIDNTVLILRHRLTLKNNLGNIQVITNYGQIPLVKCYPGQLNQVFMNLLSNAIDALESAAQDRPVELQHLGKITISTQVIDQDQVQIVIEDNALGMTEDLRSQIFNPFFTTKPVGKGTGLGLSISYQVITEKHQGKLWCESTLGQGSRFIIQIPLH